MKSIILAAGQGTRLRPLTNTIPKCMVQLNNKPLIHYQIELFKKHKFEEIIVIAGYKEDKIDFPGVTKIINPEYASSNMVYSLYKAEEMLDSDMLITYGDIVYNEAVLKKVLQSDEDFVVVADKNWQEYWQARMENPLDDAETFTLDNNGNIKSLGKKTTNINEIEAQYIGMIRIKRSCWDKIHRIKKEIIGEENVRNMYFTDFIQSLIDNGISIKPVFINNGWIEVDEPSDLNHSKFLSR